MEIFVIVLLFVICSVVSIRKSLREYDVYNFGRCSCGGTFQQIYLESAPLDYFYRCDKCGKEGTMLTIMKMRADAESGGKQKCPR